MIIRYLILLFMCFMFIIGFFMNTDVNRVTNYISDCNIHFIVFFVYPLIFYFLIPKFRFKFFLVISTFLSLSYGVEFIQNYLHYRSYSIKDFRCSILGCLSACFLIVYFKYLLYAVKASE